MDEKYVPHCPFSSFTSGIGSFDHELSFCSLCFVILILKDGNVSIFLGGLRMEVSDRNGEGFVNAENVVTCPF